MQDIRSFLLFPRIKVLGKTYEHLVAYFLAETKRLQKGHAINVQTSTVAGLIASPGVALHNTLLNTPSACVCDVVHWGLIALAKKLMSLSMKRNQVVACPPPLVECVFSTCLLLCMRSS